MLKYHFRLSYFDSLFTWVTITKAIYSPVEYYSNNYIFHSFIPKWHFSPNIYLNSGDWLISRILKTYFMYCLFSRFTIMKKTGKNSNKYVLVYSAVNNSTPLGTDAVLNSKEKTRFTSVLQRKGGSTSWYLTVFWFQSWRE